MAAYKFHLGMGRDGRLEPEHIAADIREMQVEIIALLTSAAVGLSAETSRDVA